LLADFGVFVACPGVLLAVGWLLVLGVLGVFLYFMASRDWGSGLPQAVVGLTTGSIFQRSTGPAGLSGSLISLFISASLRL